MALTKTASPVVKYHLFDGANNNHVLEQPAGIDGSMSRAAGGAAICTFAGITLTQQNAADLIAALTPFANTGVLT